MSELIVAYYGGDEEVRLLSNFAHTPFVLDGERYESVEGFWQSLKTEDPILRRKIASMVEPLDTRQLGRSVANGSSVFTYRNKMYVVASLEHHILLERAIRAKVDQNEDVALQLLQSHPRPLRHRTRNRFGVWRPGDSPSLPAIVFENILLRIREELVADRFVADMPQPEGLSVEFA